MQYEWAEDDFELPYGVSPLDLGEPDSDGTYIMYHGTTKAMAESIQQSPDWTLGRGVYLSRDLQEASRYPIDHPESDKVVIKVQVNVGKVIAINCQGNPCQKNWHDRRYNEVYDTACVPPDCGLVPSGLEEDCVWDPKRIKILKTINPRPVHHYGGYGARRYMDPDTNMQYQWVEDDCELPDGVSPLGLSAPVWGRTYVMYHGTTKASAKSILKNGFRQSPDGTLGRGVYLSRDLQKAIAYPIGHPESDKVVIKVQVNVGKVIAINCQRHPRQKTWHDYSSGYDTAWVPADCGMVPSGLEKHCVWDPNKIKILKTINPRPVHHHEGAGAQGDM